MCMLIGAGLCFSKNKNTVTLIKEHELLMVCKRIRLAVWDGYIELMAVPHMPGLMAHQSWGHWARVMLCSVTVLSMWDDAALCRRLDNGVIGLFGAGASCYRPPNCWLTESHQELTSRLIWDIVQPQLFTVQKQGECCIFPVGHDYISPHTSNI